MNAVPYLVVAALLLLLLTGLTGMLALVRLEILNKQWGQAALFAALSVVGVLLLVAVTIMAHRVVDGGLG